VREEVGWCVVVATHGEERHDEEDQAEEGEGEAGCC
jgi:hypothetical protein